MLGIKFRVNPVQRYCPKCGRIFNVRGDRTGMAQACLFCNTPLEDLKR